MLLKLIFIIILRMSNWLSIFAIIHTCTLILILLWFIIFFIFIVRNKELNSSFTILIIIYINFITGSLLLFFEFFMQINLIFNFGFHILEIIWYKISFIKLFMFLLIFFKIFFSLACYLNNLIFFVINLMSAR